LLALFVGAASAFAPVHHWTPSTSSPLRMVAGGVRTSKKAGGGMDSWSDKPLHREEETSKSTPAVPVRKVGWLERRAMKDRMIDPDYTLALGTALLCPLIIWYHPCELNWFPK